MVGANGQIRHRVAKPFTREQVDLFNTITDALMQSSDELALIKIARQHKFPILSSNKVGIPQDALFGSVAAFYTLGKIAGVKTARIWPWGTSCSEGLRATGATVVFS